MGIEIGFYLDTHTASTTVRVVYDVDGPRRAEVALGCFATKDMASAAMKETRSFLRNELGRGRPVQDALRATQAFALRCDGNLGLSGPESAARTAQKPSLRPSAVVLGAGGPPTQTRGAGGPRRRRTFREWLGNRRRAGRRPKPPRHRKARLAKIGRPPSRTIWDRAYHCVKCGRALSNPKSQHHRVGTDCIKRYGSQARQISNPARAKWEHKKIAAEADRIARQVVFDAEFTKQKSLYDEAYARWRRIRDGE